MRREDPSPDLIAVLIDEDTMAVYHIDVGVLEKELPYGEKGVRHQQIVRVDPAHDFSLRVGKSAIDGIRLSVVRHRFPACELIGVALDQCGGTIRRPAILNVVVEIGVTLTEHTFNCLLQKRALVQAGRYDLD